MIGLNNSLIYAPNSRELRVPLPAGAPVVEGYTQTNDATSESSGETYEDCAEPECSNVAQATIDEVVDVRPGDTLTSILQRGSVNSSQVHAAVAAITSVFNPKNLSTRHQVELQFEKLAENDYTLRQLRIQISPHQDLYVEQSETGAFQAALQERHIMQTTKRVAGRIEQSLYVDATRLGAHPKVLAQTMRAFAYDVDFQRSFRVGDAFSLVYDVTVDPKTGSEYPGDLLCASVVHNGQAYKIFRFEHKNGQTHFYNEKGESVRRGLLRTPIDGARISSGFGIRRHPILGYSKMHKGVDFAAPAGTPIKAAGDGKIVRIGTFGSFGKYVQIRHNSRYATAYAHLSRYAAGLRPGSCVRQGQVIGYVGSTGRAKGSHLHYELLSYGKQINPKHIRSLPTTKLPNAEMRRFRQLVASLEAKEHELMLAAAEARAPSGSSEPEGGKTQADLLAELNNAG